MKLPAALARGLTWIPIAVMSAGLGTLSVFSAFTSTSLHDGVRTIEYESVIASAVLATFAALVWPSFAERTVSPLRVVAQLIPAAFFLFVAVLGATVSFRPSDPNDASEVKVLFPLAILLLLFLLAYLAAVIARVRMRRAPIPDPPSD